MRILFLTHRFYPDVGGIEVNSEILAEAFQQAGHQVRVITWSREAVEKGREKEFTFAVRRSPSVLTLIKQHWWADVVYENNPCIRLSWPAVFFAKPGVIALCATLKASNKTRTAIQERLKLRWLKRARSVIAVSDAMRRSCWPEARVIKNPYRTRVFYRKRDVEKNGAFVFVGRLVSDKGVDLAVYALSLLVGQEGVTKQDYSLTVVGGGPELENIKALAAALGVTDHVKFVGMLTGDALASCLNKHRFLIVPSVCEEGFGNVVLEGMACGCIPIVSDGGGLPEAVGKAGLIFPRGDADALKECMRRLTEDAELREKLTTAAADHLAGHQPDVVATKYLEVLVAANTFAL